MDHAADYVLSAPDLVEFDRRNHAVFGIGLASQEMIAAYSRGHHGGRVFNSINCGDPPGFDPAGIKQLIIGANGGKYPDAYRPFTDE